MALSAVNRFWSSRQTALLLTILLTSSPRPLLVRRAWPFGRQEGLLLALAASGIAGDLVIKALVAPTYGLFLRQLAGGGL